MKIHHKVSINVTDSNGRASPVLKSGSAKARAKFMKFLLGDKLNILVISPEDSVHTVEIHELKDIGHDEETENDHFKY